MTRSEPPVDDPDEDTEFVPDTGDDEVDALRPIQFTGELPTDPRSKAAYSADSVVEQVDKILPGNIPDTREDEIRMEEFQIQLTRIDGGDFTPKLTPKPLTPEQLKNELKDKHVTENTVWVRTEPEIMAHTAVGEYRDHVDGDIVRFTIDTGSGLVDFELVPDYSPTGFSWYTGVDQTPLSTDASLDVDQARRLEPLLAYDGSIEGVISLDDKVRNASLFLQKPLVGTETVVLPPGWANANCEIDETTTEFLFPRYMGTFVHADSEIVFEFSGVEPSEAEREKQQETLEHMADDMSPSGSLSGSSPRELRSEETERTHTYELHFASDDIVETIHQQFGTEITGRDARHILERIDSLVG